jgi:D-alanyl-D-alanine carboxypeptidase
VLIGACASARQPPSGAPAAKPQDRPLQSAAIDAIGAAALRDGAAVGLSIVVMHGDAVVHAAGYGMADVERAIAADESTVYPLASLSKQFWAIGIVQLEEAGRLSIDAPVASVLDKFPDRRVLVKHLLTQTSGLGDDRPDEDDVGFTDHPVIEFEPGTWWRYSNRGALVARRIVEHVSGRTWDTYLHEHIAKPLGLRATTCTNENHAALYDELHEPWSLGSEAARLQFVCASALDVATFEHAFDAGKLVRTASVSRMRDNVNVAGLALPYGWFTRIADLDGHRAFGHTGTLPGASVAAFRFPDDDLTIVVLMSSMPKPGFRAHELVTKIARAELGLRVPVVADQPVTSEQLAAIIGSYREGPVRAVIGEQDGHAKLALEIDGKQIWTGPLTAVGNGSFVGGPDGTDPDQLATFLPANGKAKAIAIGHRLMLNSLFRRE